MYVSVNIKTFYPRVPFWKHVTETGARSDDWGLPSSNCMSTKVRSESAEHVQFNLLTIPNIVLAHGVQISQHSFGCLKPLIAPKLHVGIALSSWCKSVLMPRKLCSIPHSHRHQTSQTRQFWQNFHLFLLTHLPARCSQGPLYIRAIEGPWRMIYKFCDC